MNAKDLYNMCIDVYREFFPARCGWKWCAICTHSTGCDMVIIAKNMIIEGGLMI